MNERARVANNFQNLTKQRNVQYCPTSSSDMELIDLVDGNRKQQTNVQWFRICSEKTNVYIYKLFIEPEVVAN